MPAPMTIHHPYVEAYLRCAAASMHEAERRSHEVRSSSDCVNPSWHALAGHGRTTNWWRVEYGGVARPEAVANSLATEYTPLALNAYEARRVYALAALAVYAFPTHPAHWAFWARNAKQRAAEVVHEIVCETPKRIVVPNTVAWIDIEYNLICLRTYQLGWLPQIARPTGHHVPAAAAIKKKHGAVATRASARVASGAKNPNGKRAAPAKDEEEVVEIVELPAPKRQKRGVAAGTSTKKAAGAAKTKRKKTAKAAPTRGPPAARRTSNRTRGAAKVAAETPTTPPTIRIAPPSQRQASASEDEVVVVDVEASASAAFGQYRTPEHTDLSSSPLTSVPSSSPKNSSDSSPTPRRPQGRCLHGRALSGADSDTSASLTIVENSAASDASSTRAGTPLEDDVFGEKAALERKAVPSPTVRTPMRKSTRIQAKKSSPQTSEYVPSPTPASKSKGRKQKA